MESQRLILTNSVTWEYLRYPLLLLLPPPYPPRIPPSTNSSIFYFILFHFISFLIPKNRMVSFDNPDPVYHNCSFELRYTSLVNEIENDNQFLVSKRQKKEEIVEE